MDASMVPLMFRAQLKGRCQLHYIPNKRNGEEPDSKKWVREWTDKAHEKPPEFGKGVETHRYQVSWRFVTNGGQDEGIIRPAIGGYGWPFYPGSSMKGIFRQACYELEALGVIAANTTERYCGNKKLLLPGCLRFHGGYPSNRKWVESLLDIVHPQEHWQVKHSNTSEKVEGESGFAQISLYKPELIFGISAQPINLVSKEIEKELNWDEVWTIWEHALTLGLGCRVSAGYGRFKKFAQKPLIEASLDGEVLLPKTLDDEFEFRPNMFRAAIRGHAQRIFGGLLSESDANSIVQELFGGIGHAHDELAEHGLLNFDFNLKNIDITHRALFNVVGTLNISVSRSLNDSKAELLGVLTKNLLKFAMIFGGFGKSWRRVDHDQFFDQDYNHQIGTYWEWGETSLPEFDSVASDRDISGFLSELDRSARQWIQLSPFNVISGTYSSWREAWNENNVCVYARIAGNSDKDGIDDSVAIHWFHQQSIRDHRGQNLQIKNTKITGYLGRGCTTTIGRVWHRMYPIATTNRNGKTRYSDNPRYIEILTLFPDGSEDFNSFLSFLNSNPSGFRKVYGR